MSANREKGSAMCFRKSRSARIDSEAKMTLVCVDDEISGLLEERNGLRMAG